MESNQFQIVWSVISTLAAIGLALAYFLRRAGDTSLGKVKVDQTKADEELDKTKALVIQTTQVLDLFKQQLFINEENRKEREVAYNLFKEAQNKDEENYKVLKAVVEDGNQYLHGTFIKELRALATNIATSNQTNFKMMGAEIGVAIANELAIRYGSPDLYPFPEFDDPLWKEITIAPKGDKVCVYKRPLKHEAFVVNSESGCFDRSEKVKLADRPGEFYAIFRYANNLWGWVLKSEVSADITQPKVLAG